jgi:hypothetical protein
MALAAYVAVVGALRVVDGLGKGGKDAPATRSVAGPPATGGVLLAVGHGECGLRTAFALAALPAVAALVVLRRVHDVPRTPGPVTMSGLR